MGSRVLFTTLLITFLAGLATADPRSRTTEGQRGYLAYCAVCHGTTGAGDGPFAARIRAEGQVPPAPLTNAHRMVELGRKGVRTAIGEGGAHTGRSAVMPAWGFPLGAKLTDRVATYVMALAGLPAEDRAALEAYLVTPPGAPAGSRALYVQYCSGCHGGSGDGRALARPQRGGGPAAPALAHSSRIASWPEERLLETIGSGGAHAPDAPSMPGWINALDEAQVAALAGYVRRLAQDGPPKGR